MSEGCVPLLRACPAEASALGRDAAAAITSTGLRAVEQEPDLLCRRDLFFHRLREEAKPAALSFLGTACEGSPSRHVPWEGTRCCPAPVVFSAGMQVANLYSWGWETQGLQLISRPCCGWSLLFPGESPCQADPPAPASPSGVWSCPLKAGDGVDMQSL